MTKLASMCNPSLRIDLADTQTNGFGFYSTNKPKICEEILGVIKD